LNERIIELIDIAPKSFGAPDTHLEMIKKILSKKLKIVAERTTLKALEKKKLRRVRKTFSNDLCSFYTTIISG
jgi:hypothetical protein